MVYLCSTDYWKKIVVLNGRMKFYVIADNLEWERLLSEDR